ncbi:MAG TPA: glycosyltransferase [Thermoplasmata archaeon]|nr:glycosyltransferase [Thermoplasmata archaeon]
MPARSLAIVHLTPPHGNTGGHRQTRLVYDLLRRHFDVREYPFALGNAKLSAVYYPLYPLARPLADGLRERFDVVFGEWCGYFPVASDLVYIVPSTPPPGPPVSLRRLVGIGPRPAAGFWPPPLEWLYFNPLVRPLVNRAALDALDRTGTLAAGGGQLREQIRAEFGRDARVIYPGVPQDKLEALVHLRSGPHDPRVLVISRIVPEKHLEDVVAIANELPRVPFAVVGYLGAHGPSYLEQLRKLNRATNVEFYPNLDEEAKRTLLGRSRVLLNPSQNDTFPIGLLEGMVAGLAPVAHASGGPLEYLEPAQMYLGPEEGVRAVQAALEEGEAARLRVAERAREMIDPARLEREFVDAVQDAYVARRR